MKGNVRGPSLSLGEFERWSTSLERQMREGFDRVTALFNDHVDDDRRSFDNLESGRVQSVERIARLEERTTGARRNAQGWGAGVGAAVAAIISLLGMWFQK